MAYSEYEYKYQVRDLDVQLAIYKALSQCLEDANEPPHILSKYARAVQQLGSLIDRRKWSNQKRLEVAMNTIAGVITE